MLVIGLLFNVYNSIKQGITVIYFTHYLHHQLLAASYMVGLMIASIAEAWQLRLWEGFGANVACLFMRSSFQEQ